MKTVCLAALLLAALLPAAPAQAPVGETYVGVSHANAPKPYRFAGVEPVASCMAPVVLRDVGGGLWEFHRQKLPDSVNCDHWYMPEAGVRFAPQEGSPATGWRAERWNFCRTTVWEVGPLGFETTLRITQTAGCGAPEGQVLVEESTIRFHARLA